MYSTSIIARNLCFVGFMKCRYKYKYKYQYNVKWKGGDEIALHGQPYSMKVVVLFNKNFYIWITIGSLIKQYFVFG